LSDDYVFDRNADTWVRANDLAELKPFFRTRDLRRTTRFAEVLLIAGMLAILVAPLFAEFVMMAALASAIVAYRASTVSRMALMTSSG
jgi:uncharacterized membrane protein